VVGGGALLIYAYMPALAMLSTANPKLNDGKMLKRIFRLFPRVLVMGRKIKPKTMLFINPPIKKLKKKLNS